MANYSRSGLLNPRQNQRGLGVNRFLTNPNSTGYPGQASPNNYGITPNVSNNVGQPNVPKKKRNLLQKIGGTLGGIASGTNRFLQNWGGQMAPPGMDLTGSQKIGLLANQFKSMGHDSSGNFKDTVSPYLQNIAGQNEYAREQKRRADQLAAISGSGMTPQQQALMSSLPGDDRSSAITEYLEAQGGYGSNSRLGSAGMNEVYFEDTDNNDKLIIGQPFGGAKGGFLVGGKLYGGVGQEPVPDNWRPINSPTNSAALMGSVAGETRRSELEVELENLQDPQFLLATANFQNMEQAIIQNADIQGADRLAKQEHLNTLRDDIGDSFLRTQDMASHRQFIDGKVDAALEMTNWWSTGLRAKFLSDKPGTDAYELANLVMVIEANLGFDKLQAMRDASPTGGALGQVSERELDFLKGSVERLNTARSEAQFTQALNDVKASYKRLWDNQVNRFNTKFGVDYNDPNAIETGREVIDQKIQELQSQGYSMAQIDDWLYVEDAEIGPIRPEGGSGKSPVELELERRRLAAEEEANA